MNLNNLKDFNNNVNPRNIYVIRCDEESIKLFKKDTEGVEYKSFINEGKSDIINYYLNNVLKEVDKTHVIFVNYKHLNLYRAFNSIKNKDVREIEYYVYMKDDMSFEESKEIHVELEDNIVLKDDFKFKDNSEFKKISNDIENINNYDDMVNNLIGFKGIKGFNQKNPYHEDDLLEHSKKVIRELYHSKHYNKFESVCLGYFHDVGKLYTQKFKDDLKTHAMYIGHENVSGYIALLYGLDVRLVKVIYNHMLMMNYNKSNKVKEKVNKSILYNDLIIFNKCDKDR